MVADPGTCGGANPAVDLNVVLTMDLAGSPAARHIRRIARPLTVDRRESAGGSHRKHSVYSQICYVLLRLFPRLGSKS